jgi:membrane fusion protein, multidrug efflux system
MRTRTPERFCFNWNSLLRVASGLLLLAISVVFIAACSGNGARGDNERPRQPTMMAPAVPVMVGKVSQKTIPVEVRVIGNGEAYSTVQVKSQVDGQVERVYFQEGQDVKKGDLLFTIDRRPFEATLQQTQANLAKDTAQEKNAEAQAERNEQLFREGIISKDQYDQFRTNADALKAAVRADQAAVENAKIQLGYCSVFSPLDGRTGALMIHPGNVVKANDAALVVVNQISPLYVDFSAPEQYLAEIRRFMAAGRLKVQASVPNDPLHSEDGFVSFVNNTIDANTGTVLLKGTFANPERRLWPGQFVNVVLTLTSKPNAVVAPSQAVQTGQQGQYAFIVKDDHTVDLRPVASGLTVGGETVIEKGLQPGETVVTDGQLMLYPGARVEVKSELSPQLQR